jgi:hypothetical protein
MRPRLLLTSHRSEVSHPSEFHNLEDLLCFLEFVVTVVPCELRVRPEFFARPPIPPKISSLSLSHRRNLREIQLELL